MFKSTLLEDLPSIVGLLGMFAPFGPAIAAFWLLRKSGDGNMKELWARGWRVNFERKWLLAAIAVGPLVGLLTLAIVVILGGSIDWNNGVSPAMIVPVFIMIYLLNALPEEYGWRGYLLDPLQKRYKAIGASLILGLIWGLWHLPLVFIEGTTQAAIPFYEFVLQTMMLAVVYTWIYNNTNKSVLAVALFHASANIAGAAIPTWTTTQGRWINFTIWLVIVITVITRYGTNTLTTNKNLHER